MRKALFAALFALWPSLACAAISATNIGTSDNSAGATLTLGSVTVSSGNIVVVGVNERNGTACGTLSDGTNTYTLITSKVFNTPLNVICVFYHILGSGLSGATLTYTKNTSGVATALSALFVSGAAASSPLDTNTTNAVSVNASNSPSVSSTSAPAASGELFLGLVGWGSAINSFTQSTGWSTPFTADTTQSNAPIAGGNIVNAGATSETYSPTFTSMPNVGLIIISFKPFVATTLCTIAQMGTGPC